VTRALAWLKLGLVLLRDTVRYMTFRFRFSDSRGVYQSFDEALQAAPADALAGYDHEVLAATYRHQDQDTLAEYEYPILYHLAHILAATRPGTRLTVLDFGGNTGIHYLRLRKKLDFASVDWVVLDMPAITRVGRELCRDVPGIRFIDDLAGLGAVAVDVLVANGSLQYVEDFAEFFLQQLSTPPRHIIVGQLLLYPGQTFVTLQNGGAGACYAQYVFNHQDYIAAMAARGYALIDSWRDYSNACSIPFHSERSVSHSWGLCLQHRNAAHQAAP
jgi:putative methyltransferase (TIGR04325 family)